MHLPAAAVPAPAPGKPRPADNPQPARGGRDPVFIRHGRAPKGHMEIYLTRNRRSRDYPARPGNPRDGENADPETVTATSLSRTVQAGPDQDDLTDIAG